MRSLLVLLAVIVLLVLSTMSVFTVDPTEFVYVTQFGEPVAVYDGGANESDAGLHWRWPWPVQSVLRLDRRLQHFDLVEVEFSTYDPKGKTVDKMLVVEAYACWRIRTKDEDKDAVDRFIRRLGTPEQARLILGQRVNSALGAQIGEMEMKELISTAREQDGVTRKIDVTMMKLRNHVFEELRQPLRDMYGIELVDVSLRRFNHPTAARDAIVERIKSERAEKADKYRRDGETLAAKIKEEAIKKASDTVADAKHHAKITIGEAETEADRIRNQAHSADPEFYEFLKKLDKMHSILADNKTLLLLSTHRPVFDILFQPPRPGAGVPATNSPNSNGPDKQMPMPNPKSPPPPKQPEKGGN